jgi:hypothetical protein
VQAAVALWLQAPAPVQEDGGWWVVPLQDSTRPQATVAAAWSQTPVLQVPVLPQVVLTAQVVPQQMPPTQLPLMHWFAVAQARPLALRAQLLLVPEPWQVVGATQSVSAVQVVLHTLLVVSQTKLPAHVEGVAAAQAPAPVQWEIGVNVDPAGQEAVPHATPVPACWQAPLPLQAPVLPQGALELAGQRPCGSVTLAATGAQLPALPLTLQAWQVPQTLALQHTPSTQLLPVKQSVVAVQACPRRFLVPQILVLGSQIVGDRQSESTEQAALQAVDPLQT